MYLVDSHCDSIARVADGTYGIVNPYNYSTTYPQLQFVALFCSWPNDTPEMSRERTVRYIGHFAITLEKEKEKVEKVTTYAEIESALSSGKHAAMLTVEGGAGIASEKDLPYFRDLYAVGVRVFGLTWLTNALAKSNRLEDGEEDTGLTALGRVVVAEGNRLGMIFDVSHLSDKSFWDLAALSEKPVIATHSNFRTIASHSRNLTDDMAREIIRRDGMIGLNLCTDFVSDVPEKRTVETLFSHLDHCLSLGGEDHIGFGGDIDGIGGIYPAPLTEERSIHDQLIERMLCHNYPESLVEKVAYQNYLNFLKKYLT